MKQEQIHDGSLKMLLGLVVVVLLGAALVMYLPNFFPSNTQQNQTETPDTTEDQVVPEMEQEAGVPAEANAEAEAGLDVSDASSEVATISYFGEDGKTVLELLKIYADEVVTQQSTFGEYVESINGISGGTGGKYWLFYVNGEPATEGAGSYDTQDTDVIEWRFE